MRSVSFTPGFSPVPVRLMYKEPFQRFLFAPRDATTYSTARGIERQSKPLKRFAAIMPYLIHRAEARCE